MTTVVTDPGFERRVHEQRRATGADRYDEVWEGVYWMMPMPNDEHQELVTRLAGLLEFAVDWPGLGRVRAGVNLSDHEDDWEQNCRVPDLAVFLNEGAAVNRRSHWRGPADFLVEIVSPHDRTWEKIPFYSRLGVVELLIVDRDPWQLELYRHDVGELKLAGRSTIEGGEVLESRSVPLTFQLVAGEERPQIRVTHTESGRLWLI